MIGPTKLCPRGIELVLLDLDDTVLTDGSKISARVVDTIALARQHGCMVAVATGRSYGMVPEVLRRPETMDYLICANGALVCDTIGGALLERAMTSEQVLALINNLEPLHAGWYAFIDDTAYFEWKSFSYMLTGRRPTMDELRSSGAGALHTGTGRFVRKGVRFAKRMLVNREGRKQVRSIRKAVASAEDGILKIGCSLPTPDACERAITSIGHLGGFEVVRMGRQELEITAEGVTKGVSARWLMDYLKVEPGRAVAFGDSQNDLPLMEVCGTFVAVGNGDSRIKELASDVCETVYEDGVARWLERAMAEADGAAHV